MASTKVFKPTDSPVTSDMLDRALTASFQSPPQRRDVCKLQQHIIALAVLLVLQVSKSYSATLQDQNSYQRFEKLSDKCQAQDNPNPPSQASFGL